MRNFAIQRADNVEQAAVAASSATPIAGGTELLNWFRLGIAAPSQVLDISRIKGMDRIERAGSRLTIGALATLSEVGAHAKVREEAACLHQACLAAASAQIRNRATIGGNILQKTRCAYFRAEEPMPWGCNKRHPGTGCAAREGINERLAIFGWTEDCVATHASDPAVALTALDAEMEVVGPGGRRLLRVADMLMTQQEAKAVGLDPARAETRLQANEIIVGYRIPIKAGRRSAYIKVRERASYEYALVSAAAVVELEDGRIGQAALALGGVAQKPWRLAAAEVALRGVRPTHEAVRPIIEASLADARPLSQNGYKVSMAAGAATRAILEACA